MKKVDVFSKTKVRDIMSKQVVSINDTNSWHQAVKLMKKHGINRIPVVDEEGKLKGSSPETICCLAWMSITLNPDGRLSGCAKKLLQSVQANLLMERDYFNNIAISSE